MAADWQWCFDRGAFVLRDTKNRNHVSVMLLHDGRWRWAKFGASGYTTTWEEGVREALAQFDLDATDEEFFVGLANEALERAKNRLGSG